MIKFFIAAIKGAGAFRFYFQPLMAIFRGISHGKRDHQNGQSPLLNRVLLGSGKAVAAKEGFNDIWPVILIAIILDVYAQWEIFHYIYVIMTMIVIFIIVLCPYFISRDISNRLLVRNSLKLAK